jgi:hypothetical protein
VSGPANAGVTVMVWAFAATLMQNAQAIAYEV